MSKKGGYYCAFKNCRGLSRRDKRSFFRFPKDPQRYLKALLSFGYCKEVAKEILINTVFFFSH